VCDSCGCERNEVEVPIPILEANDVAACRIRTRLARAGVAAVNVLGTPGSGKTAILERTLDDIEWRAAVIVGDLATDNDARRLRRGGTPAIPIETGTGCHLTALQVEKALAKIDLDAIDFLFIENVGNLVCPALFDLGERAKVVVTSVTEGTDKPEKYPVIVREARLLVVNKLDLLPYVDFDVARAIEHARRVNPAIDVVRLSARTGDGFDVWIAWLERERNAARPALAAAHAFARAAEGDADRAP
jgi:hydrogenase nickel incorporation protein HypB